MALAAAKRRKALTGTPKPRIAPPTPARSGLTEFAATAKALGIELWPWQREAARYLTAKGPGDRWLYREVAVIVARQNGKTELLLPLMVDRLLAGKRILHTAQNRELPRLVHRKLSRILRKYHPEKIEAIRRGAGQEEVWLVDGGHYRIVAPNDDGARGSTNDLVIVDELRQMKDHSFIGAAKPTLADDAQIVYLSNAGTSESEVLNALRARAGEDARLAYLEWSAPAELADDDIAGWLQANPAIGHKPGHLEGLHDDYRAHLLSGTMPVFETEQLCRWVAAMESRLIRDEQWAAQEFTELERPLRSCMGVNMDVAGERMSAVFSWVLPDERVAVDVHDTKVAPGDIDLLRPDLEALAKEKRVTETVFDPYTDVPVVRNLKRTLGIRGTAFADATAHFVRLTADRKLVINDPEGVLAEDLKWTIKRKAAFSSYMAVKANEEHTNTAALAAIRAVWRASGDRTSGIARIY